MKVAEERSCCLLSVCIVVSCTPPIYQESFLKLKPGRVDER